MKILNLVLFSLIIISCEKTDLTPTNESTSSATDSETTYNNHLGLIQFDLEFESGIISHYEFFIDSVKHGTIGVPNAQGTFDLEMFHVSSNIRSIGFRFYDSDGYENSFSITQTINNTTNSISFTHLGSNPVNAQTNTSIPLCNTSAFEIDVISEKEATFSADFLYNMYTSEVVHLSNGTFVMY